MKKERKRYKREKYLILIFIIILTFLIFYCGKTFINNISICKPLQKEGYYESYIDTSVHKDCELIKREEIKWNQKYSDAYDKDCLKSKEKIGEYGSNCVWGGTNWFFSIFIMALVTIEIALITRLILNEKE